MPGFLLSPPLITHRSKNHHTTASVIAMRCKSQN
nr:MAG TPA: hypothetical protein [Caudoviricetes sp.]